MSRAQCGVASRRAVPPQQGAGRGVHGRASTPRLKRGADFIVNTDADNQYAGARDPEAAGAAARAARPTSASATATSPSCATCRWRKRQLQRLGSWVVRQVSDTTVPDTTSGFRAYTREAALRMTIVSEFSYTLESIIQAGKKRMAIAHVPVAHQSAHARIAAVRQHLLVYQALGAPRSSASTRCTSRSRSSPTRPDDPAPGRRSLLRSGSSTSTCRDEAAAHPAVADRCPPC